MWQRGFQPNSETKANELCALVHNHNGKRQKLGEKITRWLSKLLLSWHLMQYELNQKLGNKSNTAGNQQFNNK